jgi:hypothetical protein
MPNMQRDGRVMAERVKVNVGTKYERTWSIHDADKCAGEHCFYHNPSNHTMRHMPVLLRETGLVERTCPHGVGHPDPDSVAFFERLGWKGYDVHGCDGCCHAD